MSAFVFCARRPYEASSGLRRADDVHIRQYPDLVEADEVHIRHHPAFVEVDDVHKRRYPDFVEVDDVQIKIDEHAKRESRWRDSL
ncbi:hypothetical protein [Salinicoccus halodurans]|uniref:hypothetical protein n=1 Tax=Salinicoccus halodurans TaxID=407035 RepID=UPI000941F5A8|nr:hypothetical protein [Salinicoccus halodurans]